MSEVLVGGDKDFLLVRHLVLRGSQRAIGRSLAVEVQRRFMQAPPDGDPLRLRARRRWFERNWPQHAARMEGIAEVLSPNGGADGSDVTDLPAVPFRAGCSALWCPPSASSDGRARIGRNFDFVTGSALEVAGLAPDSEQPPMLSRPYVIETYPDDGHAALAVAGLDLSGCFDGVNDAGLAVALFADDESDNLRPTLQVQAGLHELQLPRFLLDTCTTVDEAIEALYEAKQYDNFITCHYLVADRDGDAFVWERDTHNREHVIRAIDAPMCVTNYLLHRHPGVDALPADRPDANMYQRAQILDSRTRTGPLSHHDIADALHAVRVEGPDPVARTVWSAIYDLEARSVELDFYLGETPHGQQRRSPPIQLTLAV
jgi:hypothetical protein